MEAKAAHKINKLALFSADILINICLIHFTVAYFLFENKNPGNFFTVSGLLGVFQEL